MDDLRAQEETYRDPPVINRDWTFIAHWEHIPLKLLILTRVWDPICSI